MSGMDEGVGGRERKGSIEYVQAKTQVLNPSHASVRTLRPIVSNMCSCEPVLEPA